jgi:hypothetical protein
MTKKCMRRDAPWQMKMKSMDLDCFIFVNNRLGTEFNLMAKASAIISP